jgi:hypothetical protein
LPFESVSLTDFSLVLRPGKSCLRYGILFLKYIRLALKYVSRPLEYSKIWPKQLKMAPLILLALAMLCSTGQFAWPTAENQ